MSGEPCNCISEIDAKLAEHNSKLEIGFTLSMSAQPGHTYPALTTRKIDPKKREKVSVIPTYCPFCGAAYRAPGPKERT